MSILNFTSNFEFLFAKILTKLKKKSAGSIIKRLIVSILVLLIILPISLYYLRPKATEAAWWDDSFAYRQKITFTHNAALTYASMRLTISNTDTLITAGKMQADCDDSRFTDSSGKVLRYRLISGCNSASTVYDVIFPTVLNGDNLTFFYYANPSAISLSDNSIPTGTTPSGTPSFATEEKGPGPVVYYKFDEGYGTVANSSGSCATCSATLTNIASPPASTSGWMDNGKLNKALKFDGLNDIVVMADNSHTKPATDMTISLWVNLNRTASEMGANQMFVYKSHTDSPWFSYQFYQQYTDDKVYFQWRNSSNTSFTTYTNSTLAANKWYHITYVKNGSTGKIYINGVDNTYSSDTHSGTIFDSNSNFSIGGVSPQWTNGAMDEVKLYNYALSEAQVKTEVNKGSSAVMGSNEQSWINSGLIGYWKFDETSGDASDSSGKNITLTNNNSTNYTLGKFANAGWYNESVSNYFSTTTDISGIQTITFWASTSATTDEFINLATGTIDITAASGVVNGTGFNNPKIYINGILNGTISADTWNHVILTSDSPVTATDLWIGRTNAGYTNGKIDDVRLYNRVLTSREISNLAEWGPEPVGWWKLDDRTGSTAIDSSGNNNTGSWIGSGQLWSTGKSGSAGNFNRTNYINVGSPDALDRLTLFTQSAWVYFESTPSGINDYYAITSKGIARWDSWFFVRTGVAGVDVRLRAYWDYSGQAADSVCFNPRLKIKTWHYVSLTYDESNDRKLHLYINGQECRQYSNFIASTGSRIDDGNNNYTIGSEIQNANNNMHGKIDDVRIYNYVRSKKQIISDMNAGHPAVGSPIGSALIYYKFDEGYGSITNNFGSIGDASNGTLTNNPVWKNSGKLGKSLWLNGSNHAITSRIEKDPLYENSISIWINPSTSIASKTIVTSGKLATDANSKPTYGGCTGTPIPLYQWTHILAVSKSSTSCEIYQNGTLTASGTTGVTFGNTINIGASSYAGMVDNFKFYNYPLNEQEVKTEFNSSTSINLGSLSTNPDGTGSNSGERAYCPPGNTETNCAQGLNPAPVAEWLLNERKGNISYDTSGNANNGTLINKPEWTTGKIGASLNFDGIDDYINIPVSATTDIQGNAVTLSAWVFTRSLEGSGLQRIVSMPADHTLGSEKYALLIDNANDDIQFWISLSGGDAITADYSDMQNEWHYITGVYESDEMKIYIDGNLVSGPTEHVGGGNITGNIDGDLQIGRYDDTFGQYFNGKIDNVSIYNYKRTNAQIAWDYNRGAPIGHWKFNDCQGTAAYDLSSNKNHGLLSPGDSSGDNDTAGTCGSATSTEMWNDGSSGKFGSSVGLDGTNDYVQISDNTYLRFNSSSIDFSLFAWIKRSNNGEAYILSKEDADNDGWRLMLNSSNQVVCSQDATDISSAQALTDTNWHFVGCTVNRDGNGQVYIDGKANGSVVAMGTDAMATTSNISIGARSYTPTSFFSGLIDDVRIYNYALSPLQVKLLLNENSAVRFAPLTGSP